MDTLGIGNMSDETCILIGSLSICSLAGDVVESFSMLPLVTSYHIDGLLQQVEIKVLIAARGREIKISVYECLGASIEQSVDV